MTLPARDSVGPYILGLDIGTRSIGWCLVGVLNNRPNRIIRAGVRCFEAGVDGVIEAGRDASRAAARREKRLARRQHWRRAWRRGKLFHLLQHLGLLPSGEAATAEQRHAIILKLDGELRAKHLCADDHLGQQVLPYRLRAKAAVEPVELFELGRALFQLGHRRGYLSNRKADSDRGEESGVVKKGIGELELEMGDRTLGQFFASLNPEEKRIRRRWTSRQMYLTEFERIWQAQRQHHAILRDDSEGKIKQLVWKAIFFQRPLKSQKGLVGICELEPGKRHAPVAIPLAQEFRILQAVNHLTCIMPDGRRSALDFEQKARLVVALQSCAEMSYTEVRKLLKMPRGSKFTIEEGGERRILGNRTRTSLREAFGESWETWSNVEQEQIIMEVLHYRKRDALIRRAEHAWGLDRTAAQRVGDISLETGFSRHSKSALERLVPFLRSGITYTESRMAAYPQSFSAKAALDVLPTLLKARPELKNPAVCRALTELRKIVNAIVRRYGKPEVIHVELARDLKRSRDERKRLSERIRENEQKREKAIRKIFQELGNSNPRRGDVEKVLLAEECCWRCPYTDRQIDMRSLIGPHPQFDVEHIFPRRFLDDSFVNKTLCYHEENRERKRDRLPFEAYADSPQRWSEILDRVRQFDGPAAGEKLRRFLTERVSEDFVSRQLNDTRYNSTVAADFVALLYGGRWDADGTQRVHTLTGGVTSHLRNEWMLNSILGDGGKKSRDDHRHHAVDAAVIALCNSGTVEILQRAAEEASQHGSRRMFATVQAPWNGFLDETRGVIDAIHVSHRVNRKIAGPLHAESLYSKPQKDQKGSAIRHIRKQLHKLSISEINGDKIVDPAVRKRVQDKFEELGGNKPEKVFADPANHPYHISAAGRRVPIHKVRVRVGERPRTIGKGVRERHVASGKNTNHHTVVVAVLNEAGEETKWQHHVIERLAVSQRLSSESRANGTEVIQRNWGPRARFKFTLCPGDALLARSDGGADVLYRVASVSQDEIQLWEHCLASPSKVYRTPENRIRTVEQLRKRNARKVTVLPLGDIVPATN